MSRGPLQQLLGGLGTMSQSGIFRAAVQNLWVTVPLGIVAAMSIQKRRKNKTLTPMNVITDIAPMVMVVGTLVILNHTLEEREKTKPKTAPAGPSPLQANAIEASFVPTEGAHPVIAATEAAPPIPSATPVQDDPYGT